MNNQLNFSKVSLAFFLFLLLTFLANPAFAQSQTPTRGDSWASIYDRTETSSFEAIQEDFRTYWDGREVEKGKGYKPFKRWEAYMAPRIFPSNDMSLVNNTYFNYMKWEHKQQQLGESKSFAGNWSPLGPFTKAVGDDTGVGRLNMVRFNPKDNAKMYVGAADGGLWRSVNSGASWYTKTDMLGVIGVADLVIHPVDTATLYLATGDAENDRRSIGVLKSIDGGDTWLPTGLAWTAIDNYSIRKLIMDPTNSDILLAATSKGVFRTDDAGVTWTSAVTFQNFKDIEFKPGDPNTVYACSNQLWKSIDNGVSFVGTVAGLPTMDVIRLSIAVTPAAPNSVYVMAGKGANYGLLGIFKSTDSGDNFSTQYAPNYGGTLGLPNNPNILGNNPDGSDDGGQSFYTLAFAVSPVDPDYLLAGGVSQWVSTDGGAHWTISSHWNPYDGGHPFVHADSHEIVFNAAGTKAYASHDGGLAEFDKVANTWTDLSNNLNISQQNIIGMSAADPNKTAAGLQDIGTILNTLPNTWKIIGGGDGEYCFIDYSNDNVIVETGTNGYHAISFDCGVSFNSITSGLPTASGDVEFQSPIHQDPVTPNRYYAGGRTNLYRSDDQGGFGWDMLGAPFGTTGQPHIKEFKIAPSNNNIIYATNGFNIQRSADAGVTWVYADASNNANITQLAISNTDPNKVWVTCSGYLAGDKVWKTINGGVNWTNVSGTLPNIPFNTIAFENGSNERVYIGSDIGVYHRDANATGWTAYFDGLPRTSVRDLKIFYPAGPNPGMLRAATYGRGTWETPLAPTALPVELLSFTGTTNGKINLLDWQSAAEIDFDYYQVERSNDAQSFASIARVQPHTTGRDITRSYEFEDQEPLSGLNYYRLKMVDLEGSFVYSNLVVLFNDDATSEGFVISPNPVTDILNLTGAPETVKAVNVRDQLGRVVIAGVSVVNGQINVSRLPNGTYYLELIANDKKPLVKRFIKM